jgi:hypothetical protein
MQQALAEIARALTAAHLPYMVIGGIANAHWGVERATVDIDITVGVAPAQLRQLLAAIADQLVRMPPDPEQFVADTGVFPAIHRLGVRFDFLLTTNAYGDAAITRAVDVDVLGVPVKYCTAEDLILHKLPSPREKDRADVAAVLARRRKELDLEYLGSRVHELALVFDDPEIETRYFALLSS